MDTATFFIFTIIFLLVPGIAALSILNIKYSQGEPLSMFGLATTLGLVILTLYTFFTRLLGLSIAAVVILPITAISILFLKRDIKKIIEHTVQMLTKTQRVILFLILLGVFTQNIVLFRGGWVGRQGYLFPAIHDTMWNIALTNELFHHFPPEHPAMAGIPLKNNHYFYPLFLSVSRFITSTDTLTLYFRLTPVLVSLLFGVALYACASQFSSNTFHKALAVFLGYFAGNASFVIPLFGNRLFDWKGSTFFADQPFDQIINPYSVLGFTIILYILFTMFRASRGNNNTNASWMIVAGLFAGSLYGFKAFGGIIAVISFICALAVYSLWNKSFKFVVSIVFMLVLFTSIFFLTTNTQTSNISWAPGWILTQLLSSDKLNLERFVQVESFYRDSGNRIGLLKVKLFELIIYLAGNLGIRVLGLGTLIWIYVKKRVLVKESFLAYLFLVTAIVSSISIPILSNLGANAYNIVQFTPYALVLLALLTAYGSYLIRLYFVGKRRVIIGNIFIVLVLILAIPVNVKNILSKLPMPEHVVAREEISALSYLKERSEPSDIIVIDPTQYTSDPIYVSALTERRLYLGSSDYVRQTGNDPSERIKNVRAIFDSTSKTADDYEIPGDFVYLLKPYPNSELLVNLEKHGFTPFYENSKVILLSN